MLFYIGFDGLEPYGAFIVEGYTTVANKPGAMEEVVDHYRFEYVELEMAGSTTDIDGHVVAHHLRGDHRKRFALRGIDLAGHDGRTGLIVGNKKFADTAAGAGRQH